LRKVLIVSLLFLSVTSLAFADEWNKTFPVTAKPDFRLVTDDANLNVVSSDAKEIRVNVTTRGWKIPDDLKIVEHQDGNRVNVEVRMVHKDHISWGMNRSIRVDVAVPRETDLDLRTGDGNVVVDAVKGAAHIQTGDGNVDLKALNGGLNASTGDGNLKVRGRFDQLTLHTGDGNMSVYVEQGSKATSSWVLRTGDGNLDLHLPEEFSADVDAHTGDGRITSDLPISTSGQLRENDLRGKLNGGGSTVELRSGDGTIHLSRL
jgi:Putative adhesin